MNAIVLRQVSIDDAPLIHRWKSDPVIIQMALDDDYHSSVERQRQDIEASIRSDGSEYDIIELDHRPIGYIRIDWMNDAKTHAWLRFALGEQRGQGWMKRALSQYLSTLFQRGCSRVEGEVYAFNNASIALLEGLGFVREGTKRKAHQTKGQHYDVHIYGLLAEEYPSLAEGTRLELE